MTDECNSLQILAYAHELAKRDAHTFLDTDYLLLAAVSRPCVVLHNAFAVLGEPVENVADCVADYVAIRTEKKANASLALRHLLEMRPEDVWRELEHTIIGETTREDLYSRLLRIITHRLAAYGSAIWDISTASCIAMRAGYGVLPMSLAEEAEYLSLAGHKQYSLIRANALILSQRIDFASPVLLQVVQRKVSKRETVIGYQKYLAKVAELCEKFESHLSS